MMRDMENMFEHKYLSFPARGEESEVSMPPPPLQVHIWLDLFILNCLSLYNGGKKINKHIGLYTHVMK